MRKGRYIETLLTDNVDLREISKHMSGSEIVETIIHTNNDVGDSIFRFKVGNRDVNLHQREIIGITGYGECGIDKLERELENISKVESSIGYVPSDRLARGVDLNSSLKETLIAKSRRSFTTWGMLRQKKIDAFARELIKKYTEYNIKGSINCQTGTLSGGNLQKVVLARVMNEDINSLILCSPTWGIDIESANNIYNNIIQLKNKDRGIILISSDIGEVLKLSNRVLVMYKGEIIKELRNPNIDPKLVGELASGIVK